MLHEEMKVVMKLIKYQIGMINMNEPETKESKEKLDFSNLEKNLSELEIMVRKLEKNETGLEESINSFEKCVTLYKSCRGILKNAEKKIQYLSDSLKEEDLDYSDKIKK